VGSFEMLAASLAWTSEPLVLSAEWAGYRLVRNGAKVSGLGDPALAARLRLLSEQRAGFRAGLGLVTGLPFGEPKKDLGMGHLMLTPNAWLEGGTEARYVQATAGFAQALGAHAGHHNHGAAPLVAPMTQQEWVATAAAGFELRERIVLEGQAALQVPVAASEAVRAQVSLAVLLPFATGSGAVYVSRPLLGDTYDWRLGSGLRWAL
jgi:hypothetical protein